MYPVRVFDKTFVEADFTGTAWQTNLYLAFEKLLDQTTGRDGTHHRQLATSTTSLLIGTGTKAFTIETNRRLQPGSKIFIVNPSLTSQWMAGAVTTYTPSTGAVVASIDTISGAGTIATWAVISLPGTYPTAARLPLSADFGGLGAMTQNALERRRERVALGLPLPCDGFYYPTDFLEHASFARDDTSGDWQLFTSDSLQRLAYAHNSNEFDSTTGPNHGDGVQGIWSVQATNPYLKTSIVMGDTGFISAYEPGNFYLTAALKFSQAYSANNLYTCRFGLRADKSPKNGNVFSGGGIGFEIEEVAGGKQWFAVFNDGKTYTKTGLGLLTPLTTWAVCHIYGNMLNREVHMRVALSSAANANEFLQFPTDYQATFSLADWPDTTNMLMNPVLAVEKLLGGGGTQARGVFIDRMLLHKALAR